MATRRWLGRALPVKQVTTITIAGTWATSDTATITINTKDLVITIGGTTTTAGVATTIKEAWENETLTDTTASVTPENGAQDITEHAEFTATVSGSVVTLTHDTAGTPVTVTVTESTAGSGTATGATATAATGPNHWDNADNWDGGAVPVSTDDVYIDNSDVSILYGLAQTAVTLTSLTIAQNFTGTIGLPKENSAGYVEYRDDYLAISATTVTIGRGRGVGSGRIKIDTGSNQTAFNVDNTGSSLEDGLSAILWKGTHASNVLDVEEGSVGVARFGGETATIATLRNGNGEVICGEGTSLTTVDNATGTLTIHSNATTVSNGTGTMTIGGSATVTTLNVNSGTVNYLSSGTVTTANIGGPSGGILDFSGDNSARTVTNCNLKPNGQIIDRLRTVTFSNGIAVGTDTESISAI